MKLNNVTICAIHRVQPKLAESALKRSQRQIQFADELFINHSSINSLQAYNKFVIQELHKYIKTDFVLIIQWPSVVLTFKTERIFKL